MDFNYIPSQIIPTYFSTVNLYFKKFTNFTQIFPTFVQLTQFFQLFEFSK